MPGSVLVKSGAFGRAIVMKRDPMPHVLRSIKASSDLAFKETEVYIAVY